MFDPGPGLRHAKDGKLKLLAVGSPKRSQRRCPTCRRWPRAACPASTPTRCSASTRPAARRRRWSAQLHDEINKALAAPKVVEVIKGIGGEQMAVSRQDFIDRPERRPRHASARSSRKRRSPSNEALVKADHHPGLRARRRGRRRAVRVAVRAPRCAAATARRAPRSPASRSAPARPPTTSRSSRESDARARRPPAGVQPEPGARRDRPAGVVRTARDGAPGRPGHGLAPSARWSSARPRAR